VFEAVVIFLFIALSLVLYIMVTTAEPSNNDLQRINVGNSSLVLEILDINNISWGYPSDYYTNYDVLVLNSTDPAIKKNTNYTMQIDEEQNGYYGMESGVAPKDIIKGTIIQVNDYNNTNDDNYIKDDVNGNNITVFVGADPYDQNAWNNAWKQKITIMN